MSRTIHLGYEVPSGEPVGIPIHHMVITGQTQSAGKTTTLEALTVRSGLKAVAFVTKRGEGGFQGARVIRPYFREVTSESGFLDWRYVASVLEASLSEKLKFERTWIMRASKGAHTLADVQQNIRTLLADPKTRGLNADVYFALGEYLKAVVPQIAKTRWADTVDLHDGRLSMMDLGSIGDEMQHLVVRSTIDWVLKHAEDTIVVVPEAWKFIPQGRNTPVKLAAEAFIRQAAALRNYLWLDSQDIAGVEKMILKSVPVWILGVQREINEVKRTLDQMPVAVPKLKPGQIASLELGEFYACFGKAAIKTYAQPVWMEESEARAIAEGRAGRHGRPAPINPLEEAYVDAQEAARLRQQNDDLRQRVAELEDELRRALMPVPAAPEPEVERSTKVYKKTGEPVSPMFVEDDLYNAIRERLLADAPAILRATAAVPELEVAKVRRTVTADGESWLGRTAQLIAEGFFDKPQKANWIWKEVLRRGGAGAAARADEACKKLLAFGFLTLEEDGFKAVKGMKVRILEAA